jgi:hypothetical protein
MGWYRSAGPTGGGQEATAFFGLAGEHDLMGVRALVSSGVDSSDSVLVLGDLSLETGEESDDPAVFMNDDV